MDAHELLSRIQSEIETFNGIPASLDAPLLAAEFSGLPFVKLLGQSAGALPRHKKIGLTVMGITHGNEVAGLAVVNEFYKFIQKGSVSLDFPVALVLGNVAASRQNKRFIESDLNRSFDRSEHITAEQKRAKALEAVLSQTLFFLDLHQTREPSETPFFIFPYQQDSYRFARAISTDIPIVTHWQGSFSKDGRCTDEFVNRKQGIGITLELGQNSFAETSVKAGLDCVLAALNVVREYLSKEAFLDMQSRNKDRPLYTWSEIFSFPEDGDANLEPGFCNFSKVAAQQLIGVISGKPIRAQQDSRVLFPYYPKLTDTRKPSELCRLMQLISEDDLPKD